MAGWKSQHFRIDASFDAEVAKQVQVHSPSLPISTAQPERILDQGDQALERRRRRIEMPGSCVGVLEHDCSAGASNARVGFHLLVSAPKRSDLVARVDEIEGVRLELARE